MSGWEFQKDCSTCLYRTMVDDVDFGSVVCEGCVHYHLTNSRKPWPFWAQRTKHQFLSDAAAGFKVKLKQVRKN